MTEQARIAARPCRRARPPRRQPARRLDRAGPWRAPAEAHAERGREPDRPRSSPTRCASTWSSTRRYDGFYGAFIHDPLAARRGPRPEPGHDRGRSTSTSRPRGTLTTGETVADWRRADRQAGQRRRRGRAPTRPTFLDRFIDRVGGLAAAPVERGTLSAEGSRPAPMASAEPMGMEDVDMSLSWLTDLRRRPDRRTASPPIQLAYLLAIVVGVVLLAIVAVRSRDFSTATLALMPVAIAINIAVGSIVCRAAPADLPGFDRDRARRRARRAMGRRADRPAREPHLVDPAHPGRRRADGRVLRAGRRRHRPDGRLLGEPRRLPATVR